MKKFAEAWLQIGDKKIYGQDIADHHRKWMSSSYHCILCGAPVSSPKFYPCWNCKGTPNEN